MLHICYGIGVLGSERITLGLVYIMEGILNKNSLLAIAN